MYGIYINLGCRFEFRTQKLPYERISGNFSDFINFGHVCEKGQFFNISCISNVWDLHKFGLQIWIQNAKITLWKNFWAIFPISSILVIRSGYAKKDHLSILAVIQNIWDLHKFWVADLNSERKNYPMKEFRAIFPISSILVIRSGYAKKGHFPVLAVFQKIWALHKFGL